MLRPLHQVSIRDISVELLPRPDGKCFGALYPVEHVPCPTCKTEHAITLGDVTRADIKKGLGRVGCMNAR